MSVPYCIVIVSHVYYTRQPVELTDIRGIRLSLNMNEFSMEDLTAHPASMSRSLRAENFDYDDVFYYFLASLGLLLLCFWTRSRVPGSEFHIWERRRAELRELEARTERMSNPEYRMNLILKAIVIKKIVQEVSGQLLLGDDDGVDASHSTTSGSHSIDSMDENTCVICLDPFRVGDVVAWSSMLLDPNEPDACSHVFHKDCLLSYFMHGPTHDSCPYCRSPVVKEAAEAGNNPELSLGSARTAAVDESGRGINSAFVIMHGLVSRVRRASASVIGQSINTSRNVDNEAELGNNFRCSSPPLTLQKSVISMEESQSLTELVPLPALRRRPRSSSFSSLPEDPGLPFPPGSPVQLRKTVSDFAALGSVSFHGPPRPHRFGQPPPMLPYPSYLRMSSFGSIGSEGRDVSESTITEEEEEDEEEDLILRPVSPLTLDMSESEVMDETEFHSDRDIV